MHIYFSILDVVTFFLQYMINSLTQIYLLLPFLILFRWICKSCDYIIFISTYKTFPRHAFSTSIVGVTRRTSFLLSPFDPFETCFCRTVYTSTKIHFVLTRFALSIFEPQPEFLSIFK